MTKQRCTPSSTDAITSIRPITQPYPTACESPNTQNSPQTPSSAQATRCTAVDFRRQNLLSNIRRLTRQIRVLLAVPYHKKTPAATMEACPASLPSNPQVPTGRLPMTRQIRPLQPTLIL